jgi:hypothetical protein
VDAKYYEDLIKEKETKRRAIMSESEIGEAEQFLVWYRRAYEDKQRVGVIQKWKDVEKYWEGDFEYEDGQAAPNTNITNSNVEGRTALLCDQNIAVQVNPREPGDKPFCDMARTVVDFIKDSNKMYRKIEVHERRRDMTGTGIFRVLWDFDKLDGKGMPVITPIHPSRIFVDPAITDIYNIQEGQYIIESRNKSIYSAKMEYGEELADAIIPNLDPVQDILVENEEDQYVHLMVWTKYKENGKSKLRLVEMSGDGVILKDTKKKLQEHNKKQEEEDEQEIFEGKRKKEDKREPLELFPNDNFPYFFTPDMFRENTIWGKGTAELILGLSDQIDDLDDNLLRNARLTGNPMWVVSNSSGIDVGKVTNEPGQAIPTNDINGIKWLTPPSIPQYIVNKRSELMNNDRQVVTRFTDQMIGKQQAGVDTATESMALQNSGNAMIDHKKGLLQETLGELFKYALELALMNWNTTMLFRIVGENGEDAFSEFNPDLLNHVPVMIESDTDYREKYKENWKANNPGKDISKDLDPEEYKYMQVEANGKKETRKIQYDLEISVGAGLPNNKAYRYSVIRQAYVDKAISRLEYRNYLIKQLGVDIQEYPETMQEQQELGIVDEEAMQEQQMIQQNPNIEGLTPAGNPQTSYMKGV